MENQNQPQQPVSTRLSGPAQPSRRASTESVPPEPYDPITEIKRRQRWEQIFDNDGYLWEVRQARGTKYGFDLLFGYPANSHLVTRPGPCRLIATPALVAHWERYRITEGKIYDLPAGRTTIKRLRKRLDLNLFVDRRNVWKKRTTDLKTLPTREFAERYNVNTEVTNSWRLLLLGRSARPNNWWHHPAALAVLRKPGLTLKEIGKAIGVGTSQAYRLRKLAASVDPQLLEQKITGPIAKLAYERKPTIPPVKVENPFKGHRKQGEMFMGPEFWHRGHRPSVPAAKQRERAQAKAAGKPRLKRKHLHSQATAKRNGQMLLPFKARQGPEPQPVLFQVRDFAGVFYDVYESRSTDHGFDLLFGFQTRAHRRLYTTKGKPGLIVTSELYAYWDARRAQEGANFDLPAGHTTLVRARMRVGFNSKKEQKAAQLQRIPDLQTLPIGEFAQKYNVSIQLAKSWRADLRSQQRADQAA